jgi:hypothetical protein
VILLEFIFAHGTEVVSAWNSLFPWTENVIPMNRNTRDKLWHVLFTTDESLCDLRNDTEFSFSSIKEF